MKRMHQFFRRLRHALAPCLGFCLALWSHTASAQVCITAVVPVVFGTYQVSGSGNNSVGSISVTCVLLPGQSVSYTVKLGLNNQSQGTQRRMKGITAYLNYNLFCDSGHSQIWADGSSATCAPTKSHSGLVGSLLTVFPVYGRIPGGQYVPADLSYSDSITFEVLY
jgi:spore coat protein U-like protein